MNGNFQQLPLDAIDDVGNDMRRVAPSAHGDAALTTSIARRGLLQPIGVRPAGVRFQLVFGHRRLRCARAAGLETIAADVRDWTDDEVRAVQKIENMQRQPPHAIDTWCAVSDLVDGGTSIAEAAIELGLDDRTARLMERLGRLHPDLLNLCEIRMPLALELRDIALAPRKVQAAAAKGALAAAKKTNHVPWYQIAALCRQDRVPQTWAIFDPAAHPGLWDEDMFAQPNDENRFTTSDIAKFLELQREALAARVTEQRAAKRRIALSECDAEGLVMLPVGWKHVPNWTGTKPSRTECIYTAVRPSGGIEEVLAVDVAAQKAAEKTASQKAKAKDSTAEATTDSDSADDADDAPAPAPEPPEDDATPYSKAGLALIAAAKTSALRKALRDETATFSATDVLELMLLGLCARNLTPRLPVEAWEELDDAARPFDDLAAQLLQPGGNLIKAEIGDVVRAALTALSRLLTINSPDPRSYAAESGVAAEWIGAAVGAEAHLQRFDTPEFLAQCKGAALRAAAASADIKATGSVKALREALAGKLPDWVPAPAQFGAPAPKVRVAEMADEAPDEGDAP